MRSQLRDNLRDKVSGKILDFVEAVPNLVSWLKSVRDHQRKEAERAHKASRPPMGTKLDLLYFQLIEVFHLEDIDKLEML
jgi:hypothetical protein